MTLRKRWCSGTVISTDGWAVAFSGRATITYWDELSRVYASAEAPAVGKTWWLYAQDMRVGSENGPPLSDEPRRTLIIARIKEAGDYSGWTVEVH